MEIQSVGSAADNLSAMKQAEAQSRSILELGQDYKKVKNTDAETELQMKNLESSGKNAETEAAKTAQGVKTTGSKETGNLLDLMG